MHRPAYLAIGACLVAFILSISPARAGSCLVATSGLAFGSYDVFRPTSTSSTGSVTLTCMNTIVDTPVMLGLSSGSSGTPIRRSMAEGGSGAHLFYNVYLQGSTMIFGNEQGGTVYRTLLRHGTPIFRNRIALVGVMPAHQDVPVGRYQDALTVKLDF